LVAELCAVLGRMLIRQLSDELRVSDGKLDGLLLGVSKNDLAKTRTRRIVHMEDRTLGTCKRLNGASDQVLPSRGKNLCSTCLQRRLEWQRIGTNLEPNITRNFPRLYKTTDKCEIRVTSSRVCDFDFFYAALYERSEEDSFLLDGHWVHESLISITEISRKPYGSLCASFGGPLTIMQIERGVR
jgi:hypothetical protein